MPTTDIQLGQVLLAQARKAIADALGLPAPAAPDHPQLADRRRARRRTRLHPPATRLPAPDRAGGPGRSPRRRARADRLVIDLHTRRFVVIRCPLGVQRRRETRPCAGCLLLRQRHRSATHSTHRQHTRYQNSNCRQFHEQTFRLKTHHSEITTTTVESVHDICVTVTVTN